MRKPKKQYRSSEGGSFMIDREVRGIGRIHRASGLAVEAQFNIVNDAIPELAKSKKGRALLTAFKAREIDGVELFVAINSKDLDSLAVGDVSKPLVAALEQWNADTKKAVALATHRGRTEMIRDVVKYSKPAARISDLPGVARAMKAGMASARSFNLDLQYLSAFLRDTLGRRHEVYMDLRDIDIRKVTKRQAKAGLSPADIRTVSEAFARVWKSKKGTRGDEVLAMVLTGMGATEYWGRWRVLLDRVHIEGPKQDARDRDIPKLFPCALFAGEAIPRPAITPTSFARALTIVRVATGIDCAPYDLRRTFARWMESAGIPRSRRKMYMGHAAGDVTEIYERHELTQYLKVDGETMRAWIASSIESANTSQPEQASNL